MSSVLLTDVYLHVTHLVGGTQEVMSLPLCKLGMKAVVPVYKGAGGRRDGFAKFLHGVCKQKCLLTRSLGHPLFLTGKAVSLVVAL